MSDSDFEIDQPQSRAYQLQLPPRHPRPTMDKMTSMSEESDLESDPEQCWREAELVTAARRQRRVPQRLRALGLGRARGGVGRPVPHVGSEKKP